MILINGKLQEQISAGDRGLAYGQGVFETILVINGTAQFLNWHIERLLDGCRRIGIPVERLVERLEQDMPALPTEAVLKLTVTRGAGGRGYAVSETMEPTLIIQLSAMPDWPDSPGQNGIRIVQCETQLAQQPLLAGVKHLNRLEQVLARAEWSDPQIREGLVCDTAGNVIEGTMSNLFFVRGNRLYTPDLTASGVAGIIRRWVLESAPGLGWKVEIGQFSPGDVRGADELFFCNSLIGIWPVIDYQGSHFEIGKITRALQSALVKEYEGC